jgi:hypothetical protein
MLMEGIITLIIVAALFYVAPGVLNSVQSSTGLIVTSAGDLTNCNLAHQSCILGSTALNQSQAGIGTTAAGALNLSTIGLIMLGIGIMIGGFMLIRNR